jgi:hypothetical protein
MSMQLFEDAESLGMQQTYLKYHEYAYVVQ